ncbi:ABC transporter permease [Agromyces sp. SYSU T00194]|uniref:ABC transporter permease n=1 Tax=Agromyces chitinivorans TaxID=3158560 RepID=UPI0033935A4D
MNLFAEAFAWLLDPANWEGPSGIGVLLAQHVVITFGVVAIACGIGIPLGMLVGHTGRGREVVVTLSGGLRALPSLGVLTLVALWLGIGVAGPAVALVVLAVPSVLAGTYSAIEAVDRRTVDAARGMGMTERQIILGVETPIGLPTLIGGVRTAVLQVVATATLAAYVGAGGLGSILFLGLKTGDYTLMLASSMLVIALALVLDGVFALLQRIVVPAGVRATRSDDLRGRSTRRAATTGQPATEGNT